MQSVLVYLRDMDTLSGEKLPYCYASFGRGVYHKMKEFVLSGSKFIPCSVESFSERTWCAGKQKESYTKKQDSLVKNLLLTLVMLSD